MKCIFCWLLSLFALLSLSANNNLRNWNLMDGSRIHAELVEYDEEMNQVYLRVNETDDLYLKLEDFTALDQAWLVEWTRMSGKLMEMLDKTPGEFTAYQFEGELDTHSFYVYEPSSVIDTGNRPLMLLISAGPKGMRLPPASHGSSRGDGHDACHDGPLREHEDRRSRRKKPAAFSGASPQN